MRSVPASFLPEPTDHPDAKWLCPKCGADLQAKRAIRGSGSVDAECHVYLDDDGSLEEQDAEVLDSYNSFSYECRDCFYNLDKFVNGDKFTLGKTAPADLPPGPDPNQLELVNE